MYQWPVLRDVSPQPGAEETSTASASGINLHSHQYVVPNGVNLLQYRSSTLVSEGHNHIIINGKVQPTLGHTHEL